MTGRYVMRVVVVVMMMMMIAYVFGVIAAFVEPERSQEPSIGLLF
jgi:hypothetical protein